MKTFEIFSENKKKGQNGRRKFRLILHKIFPDSCIDEVNEVGTEYNGNGITWIKEYCEKALPSIEGMFLRCEFLDDARTELCGHGMTDIVDGVPIFENATTIGRFTRGYIDEATDEDGNNFLACFGEGEIDSSCYHNFCEKLDEIIANGDCLNGSVEIMRTAENKGIVYKYGNKDKGRLPTEYLYSGYCLLGITPADTTAKLIELNNKEDKHTMNDMEIKNLVEQTVNSMTNHVTEINQIKAECDKTVAEINEKLSTSASETAELTKSLEEANNTISELNEQINKANEKIGEYEKALDEAKAKERVGELNSAIADFSDEEKEYAKAEIDAFNADPVASEINSVVSKIWEGIGKKAKEDAVVAEQNSAKQAESIEDIFAPIDPIDKSGADIDIFG